MSSTNFPETSFELAMDRLEEIVSAMESDRMPLDEMVTSYEEGMKLLQLCRHRIEAARQRIETISLGSDGKAELATFDPARAAETSVDEKAKTASATRRRTAKPDAEDASDDIRLF
ncbi:MAG: exodeoxyribonuclease VII small subunit [Verrucomicrobia bacterium]|nr:exodeoxyribonuclease VII small subunit [Verrucomicrobiota bacterium]